MMRNNQSNARLSCNRNCFLNGTKRISSLISHMCRIQPTIFGNNLAKFYQFVFICICTRYINQSRRHPCSPMFHRFTKQCFHLFQFFFCRFSICITHNSYTKSHMTNQKLCIFRTSYRICIIQISLTTCKCTHFLWKCITQKS